MLRPTSPRLVDGRVEHLLLIRCNASLVHRKLLASLHLLGLLQFQLLLPVVLELSEQISALEHLIGPLDELLLKLLDLQRHSLLLRHLGHRGLLLLIL